MQEDLAAESMLADNSFEVPAPVRRGRKGPRNKPTLSCAECVGRKTKCDRGRPICYSCMRRGSDCTYTYTADKINASLPWKQRRRASGPGVNGVQPLLPAGNHASDGIGAIVDLASSMNYQTGIFKSARSDGSSPRMRREKFTLFPPFEAKQHPFGNYWTCIGGLGEVVGVLPSKAQTDQLVRRYFECVDPLYPIVNRATFNVEYEYFWSLSVVEQAMSDAAHLALQFAMYACAMPFVDDISPDERSTSSEFYISASHQALCLFSYLNRCSLATMQTMILINHFLINNSHVSEAWTFSGLIQRQAHGLGLHHKPEEHTEDNGFAPNPQRARLWHATMYQDTNLCLYTELPPATSYHDLDRTCLENTDGDSLRIEDAMHWESQLQAVTAQKDVDYLQATWDFAQFAQTNICIPQAMRKVVCRDAGHKEQMISEFRRLYQNWAWPFNVLDPNRFEGADTRLTLQSISLTSVFFWLLRRLHMENDPILGIESNLDEALEATHEGLAAFFALVRIYPSQADVWCANNTRAYDQAMAIATILSSDGVGRDPRRMLAKSDLERYIDIILRAKGNAEFESIRKKRLAKLETLKAETSYA